MGTAETKERILRAAAAEFAEKGFAGATTRAMAVRAGVNEVTLFRHFGTKELLYSAVLAQVPLTPALAEGAFQLLRQMAPREALLQLAAGQIKGLEGSLDWLRLQMLEPGQSPSRLQVPGFRLRTAVADCFRSWQERGLLRADLSPELAGEAFVTGIFGFVMANRVVFPSPNPPESEAYVRTFVDLLLSGMEPR